MAETIAMPKLGFDMQEGTLVRWVRSEGESINKGDILAEIETDKATVEVESLASGVVLRLLVNQGAVVPIGAPIAIVGSKDEEIELPESTPVSTSRDKVEQLPVGLPTQPSAAATPGSEELSSEGVLRASPLAKKMAREARIDLSGLKGSGPSGRIVRRDIEAALSRGRTTSVSRELLASPAKGAALGPRPDAVVALSKLRLAIARRMTESKSSAPHFYVTHDYGVESLLDLRTQANSMFTEDEKLSVNDFIVKAVALCLREFPNLNSAAQGDHILRHGAIHIGVAVAVEGGLLTVVCRDADLKPMREISQELKAMASRARAGRVRPEDIEGSTFSVSNLGMFDVENFAAIINPPEAGILAVAAARNVPVVEKGELRAGWRMKATLAVDHRVSDGAEAAQFMRALARYVETPLSLFL
jgi:pyruvate dehydrogenase E2 component (dihydrolipoamide acetyltransferase)